jgi:hypothetical protein
MKSVKKITFILIVAFIFTTMAPATVLATTKTAITSVQSITTSTKNVPINGAIKLTLRTAMKSTDSFYVKDKSTSKKITTTVKTDKTKKLITITPKVNYEYNKTYQVILTSNKISETIFTFKQLQNQ